MQVNFKARNMEITKSVSEYTEKRLSKFDKLIGADEATVTMRSIKDRYRVEVSIPYHGMVIRGEEEGYDIYACIDLVTDKLETQIHKYRSRLIKRGRTRDVVAEMPADPWVEDIKPVREKTFSTKPMTIEEAIMQMNLLSHTFFAFVNSDTGAVNVIYLRHDGGYGLLTPQ